MNNIEVGNILLVVLMKHMIKQLLIKAIPAIKSRRWLVIKQIKAPYIFDINLPPLLFLIKLIINSLIMK